MHRQSMVKQQNVVYSRKVNFLFIQPKKESDDQVQEYGRQKVDAQLDNTVQFNQFNSIENVIEKVSLMKVQVSNNSPVQNRDCVNWFQAQSQKNQQNSSLPKQLMSTQKSIEQTLQLILKKIPIKKHNYLNDYIYISRISQGIDTRVQKLKNRYTGNIFAGKIFYKTNIVEKNRVKNQRVQDQMRIYEQISHPNIAQLICVYFWRNQYSYILEYASGNNLHHFMNNHIVDEKIIGKLMYKILDTLEYLHSINIVHHDIKPENIIYDTQTESIKIIDFGQAIRIKQDYSFNNRQGGTVAYLAPQYFDHICTFKLDIWAAGVILYYLIDRKLFFLNQDIQAMKDNIRNQPISFTGKTWSGKSQYVKDLIQKMLQKDPKQRINATKAKRSTWVKRITFRTQFIFEQTKKIFRSSNIKSKFHQFLKVQY